MGESCMQTAVGRPLAGKGLPGRAALSVDEKACTGSVDRRTGVRCTGRGQARQRGWQAQLPGICGPREFGRKLYAYCSHLHVPARAHCPRAMVDSDSPPTGASRHVPDHAPLKWLRSYGPEQFARRHAKRVARATKAAKAAAKAAARKEAQAARSAARAAAKAAKAEARTAAKAAAKAAKAEARAAAAEAAAAASAGMAATDTDADITEMSETGCSDSNSIDEETYEKWYFSKIASPGDLGRLPTLFRDAVAGSDPPAVPSSPPGRGLADSEPSSDPGTPADWRAYLREKQRRSDGTLPTGVPGLPPALPTGVPLLPPALPTGVPALPPALPTGADGPTSDSGTPPDRRCKAEKRRTAKWHFHMHMVEMAAAAGHPPPAVPVEFCGPPPTGIAAVPVPPATGAAAGGPRARTRSPRRVPPAEAFVEFRYPGAGGQKRAVLPAQLGETYGEVASRMWPNQPLQFLDLEFLDGREVQEHMRIE
jgi:hypothetical protein